MNHNKKRNVGVIYELLVRAVSAYLIENDREQAQNALNIISKHYNKNTELYKEFRLLNALAKSSVKDTSIAAAILTESKNASRRFDSNKLIREKSNLIRDINHILADQDFYHRRVPEYKTYATIQTLLNAWREGDKSNLTEVVLIEAKMVEWLTSERTLAQPDVNVGENVDALVVKLMSEKFNTKYDDKLSNDQKDLIKEYVFSLQNDDGSSISGKAMKIQRDVLTEIEKIRKTERSGVILEKIDVVRKKIEELNLNDVDDSKLAKLMTLTQLINEMKGA